MALVNEPRRATQLARAIGADIFLYNEAKFKEGCQTQNPFRFLSDEVIEGYLLFKNRVSPELCSQFASALLSFFGAKALEHNVPPDSLVQNLAQALGEHANEAGALQNIVHVVTQEPRVERRPPTVAPPITPNPSAVPDSATRIKVRRDNSLEEGFFLLFPAGFAFENLFGTRDTYALRDIQDIKIDRSFGGEIQLRIEVAYYEKLYTLTNVQDLTTIVMHLLPAFGRT